MLETLEIFDKFWALFTLQTSFDILHQRYCSDKSDRNARKTDERSPSSPNSSELSNRFKSIEIYLQNSQDDQDFQKFWRADSKVVLKTLQRIPLLTEVTTSPKRTIAVEADGERNRDFLDFLEALVTIDLADESSAHFPEAIDTPAASYDNLRKRLSDISKLNPDYGCEHEQRTIIRIIKRQREKWTIDEKNY